MRKFSVETFWTSFSLHLSTCCALWINYTLQHFESRLQKSVDSWQRVINVTTVGRPAPPPSLPTWMCVYSLGILSKRMIRAFLHSPRRKVQPAKKKAKMPARLPKHFSHRMWCRWFKTKYSIWYWIFMNIHTNKRLEMAELHKVEHIFYSPLHANFQFPPFRELPNRLRFSELAAQCGIFGAALHRFFRVFFNRKWHNDIRADLNSFLQDGPS